MDKRDNINLEDLKDMVSDVESTDEFDLESIIAEVSGRPAPPKKANASAASSRVSNMTAFPLSSEDDTEINYDEPSPDYLDEDGADPRQAYMDARDARAAARREKKAARAARRAEERETRQLAAETEEGRAPRRTRRSRKQVRADKLAAKLSEEESNIRLRDPVQAQSSCKHRARGLSVRAFFVFLLTLAAAYLSIAPLYESLPLPLEVNVIETPVLGIGALILIQIIALLFGIDMFLNGLYSLFHGRPNRATIVAFSSIAAILHSASLLVFKPENEVNIPYIAVSVFLMFALLREERGRYYARASSYKVICAAQQPLALYNHYDAEDDACRAAKGPLSDWGYFLVEMERPDTIDRFSAVYSPLVLVGAIALSFVVSFVQHNPIRFFWAFSAILSVAAPLGLLCSFGAAYKNVARSLMGSGAAIAGARQANLLRGTEEVVLTEKDIFPAGSITLDSLKTLGRTPDDQILASAAALTLAAGLEVGKALTKISREQYDLTLSARGIRIIENGISGEIGSLHVIVGNAPLMVQLGYRIKPGPDTLDIYTIYVVIDDSLVGALRLRYQPTEKTHDAMRTMHRMHMNAVLAVRDFNLSPPMLEGQFNLRSGFAHQPSSDTVERLLDPDYAINDIPAAILTRDGVGPMIDVLRYADKLAGSVRSNITLGTFSGICGILIVFYLIFNNVATALPVQNLLLYLLIWYIPSFVLVVKTR